MFYVVERFEIVGISKSVRCFRYYALNFAAVTLLVMIWLLDKEYYL